MLQPSFLKTMASTWVLFLVLRGSHAQEAAVPLTIQEPISQDAPQESGAQLNASSANAAATTSGQPQQNATQSIQDQINNQPAQQPVQQPAQRRNELDRNIGTAGARLRRSPNVAGDFLGFANTSNFVADDPIFAPKSLLITGASLTALTTVPDTAGGFDTTIPASATALGTPLGQDIKLNFDSNGSVTNIDSLDMSQQQALASFLGRQGSGIAGVSGTVGTDQLKQLTATTGTPTTDISLGGVDNFDVGGFAPNQMVILPRAGVQISRFKASEGTNPIPRDRILFNYGFFKSAIGPGGTGDVNRFVPGFEKTLNDGTSSIEVRLPFAGTFDSYQPIGQQAIVAGASNTELGNLTTSFKQLIATTDNYALSGGLSLELPTADDLEFENDAFLITRSCESVTLSPFIGSLYTPNDRIFMQSFLQVSFDTNGEAVTILDKYASTTGGGILQDPTTLFVDMQVGYWVYRNESAVRASSISGIAGMLELHLNQTIQHTDFLNQTVGGVPFTFGDPNGSIGVANLTSGITTEFGQQSTLTVAYVAPLTDTDRQFDGELLIAFNYYFDKRGSPFRVPPSLRR